MGFFVYVDRSYRYINPFLEVLHFTLDGWMPYRDEGGWQLQGGELKMDELDRK